MALQHCGTAETLVIGLAVIIGLVLSLEPSDGQGAYAARPGARESVGDPGGSTVSTIDDGFRGFSWDLLVPLHTVTIPDVRAASSAGDGDALSQVPGF